MKKLIALLLVSSVLCSCSSKSPSVRVRNELSTKVNVSLNPSSGSAVTINEVLAGTTSGYTNIPDGSYSVHAAVSSGTNPADINFTAEKDKNYTIVVVAGNPPTIRVDVADK